MNFKEYYQKHILKESPMRLGMTSEDILDNDALNQQEALETIEGAELIEHILLKDTVNLSLYRTEFESTIDYFVNKSAIGGPFLGASFTESLRDLMQSQTKLNIVDDNADLQIAGNIKFYL